MEIILQICVKKGATVLIFCGWDGGGDCWSALLPGEGYGFFGVGLTMEVEEYGESQGCLQKEWGGDADGELFVAGFVADEVHVQEGSYAAAEGDFLISKNCCAPIATWCRSMLEFFFSPC